MSRYGEAMTGAVLEAQFAAKLKGVYEFRLHPELWATPGINAYYPGRAWTSVRFIAPAPPEVPAVSGIYMFVVAPHCGTLADHSYIFYVGKATNLRTRYAEYLREKACNCESPRENVVRFLNHLEDYVFFHFTPVPQNELDHAESLLKDNLTPFANTQVNIIGRLNTA